MKRLLIALLCFVGMLCDGQAQSSTSPNEGSRLSHNTSTGIYSLYWWGLTGNTYFIQHSEDLANWSYFPEIKPGANAILGENFQTNASRFFVRLRYSSVQTSDPFGADFDGDHVSNWEELQHGTDPLSSRDTGNNGFPDDWEMRYFGHLGVSPGTDSDGDGVINLNEYLAFSDPTDPASCPYQVTRFVPDDEQQGHPANGVILLYLNKPLPSFMSSLPAGIVTHTADSGATWQPVSGTWLVLPGRKTVAFFPADDFISDAVGVEDYTYRIDFTAATTGLTPVVPLRIRFSAGEPDTIGAWVKRVWPGNDYMDVATDFAPIVQWSEPLRPDTAIDSANVSLRPENGTSDLPVTLSFDYYTNRLTITPAALLQPDTLYHVALGTGFNNLKTLPLLNVYKWSFQTRPTPPPPGTGPHITATNPAAYAENVAINTSLAIAFSEAMNDTTISASTVHLRAYGETEDVNATFAYDAATHHIQVTPVPPLSYETAYALAFDGADILSTATTPQPLGGPLRFVFATASDPNGGGDPGGGPGTGGGGAGNPNPEKPKPLMVLITYNAEVTSGGTKTGGYVIAEITQPDGSKSTQEGKKTSESNPHVDFKFTVSDGCAVRITPKETSASVGLDPNSKNDGTTFHLLKKSGSDTTYVGPLSAGGGLLKTDEGALLPVSVSVKNTGQNSTAGYLTGWHDGDFGSSEHYLGSWLFQTTATMQTISGFQVQLDILQDIKGTTTVTYQDGSYTYCQSPDFQADVASPPLVTTTTDVHGKVTSVLKDSPRMKIQDVPRRYLAKVEDGGTARDFVAIKIGSNTPHVVAEVGWTYSTKAMFSPSTIAGGISVHQQPDTMQPNPVIGKTTDGKPSTHQPVDPRTPTANQYFNNSSNWTPSGGFGNQAHTYQYP